MSDNQSMLERLERSQPDIAQAFRELLARYGEACQEIDRLRAELDTFKQQVADAVRSLPDPEDY